MLSLCNSRGLLEARDNNCCRKLCCDGPTVSSFACSAAIAPAALALSPPSVPAALPPAALAGDGRVSGWKEVGLSAPDVVDSGSFSCSGEKKPASVSCLVGWLE